MNPTWKQALREGAFTGSIAAALSGAYLAWRGSRHGEPAAPINAVSHWFWGDRSLRQDAPSLAYTLAGYVTHHCASIFWAVLHARLWAMQPQARRPVPALAGAAAASSVACFVDYQLTPKRLTPGYEHRLNHKELAGVYVVFALGLAAGTLLLRNRR
jgi:hypothetical protein